jgi:hypothetical protein
MLKLKFTILYYAMKTVLCSCASEESRGFENIRSDSQIIKLANLPEKLTESSGLARASENSFWTLNDSGGKDELYEIDEKGRIISTQKIKGAKNIDWEELAEDDKGNIYIGDFGNNSQNRKNLVIYKVKEGKNKKIEFEYKDQKKFPAESENFDCEAFFWFKDELHLFTKGKEDKKLITKHYVIPDSPGKYSVSPKQKLELHEAVTAADISPDETKLALLTYGKILIFGIENEEINFEHPLECLKTRRKQTEALLFVTNSEIIFTNEQQELFAIKIKQTAKLNN